MRWEMVAAVAAGLAIAGSIAVWPRPALMCLGVVSLLLGLLGLSTLKVMSIPALVAIIGGIGLIGFGRLVGLVEQLLRDTRMRRNGTLIGDSQAPGPAAPNRDTGRQEDRIEPRL